MIPGVILFALEREMAPFRSCFPRATKVLTVGCPTWECSGPPGRFWLVRGGMGSTAIASACAELLPLRPPFVILAGFSGGLIPNLAVGQLVNAASVRTQVGESYRSTFPVHCSLATPGDILSVEQIVILTQQKRDLHEQTGALAVDLESATVARCCQSAEVPFASLRVISDAVTDNLPEELEQITHGERVRPLRLLAALVRRPGLLRDLIRLASATSTAAKALSHGLKAAFNW